MISRWVPATLLVLLSATVSSAPAATGAAAWNGGGGSYNRGGEDYADYDRTVYDTQRSRGGAVAQRSYEPRNAHTYKSIDVCEDKCAVLCVPNMVYMDHGPMQMFSCDQLKPPKQVPPFFQSIRASSFYFSLFIIGAIVVGILVVLTCCFCCNYCCRNPSSNESSRGSSKQALAHNEDGEFKEYLNGNGGLLSSASSSNGHSNGHASTNGHSHHHHDEIGAMKREQQRDFSRRPLRSAAPQIV